MLYTDEFVANLPDDPWRAMIAICDRFLSIDLPARTHEAALEAYAFAMSHSQASGIGVLQGIMFGAHEGSNITKVADALNAASGNALRHLKETDVSASFMVYKARAEATLAKHHEVLSDDEIGRIQGMIDGLRQAIHSSEVLDQRHRQRLMGRLEALQRELHKRLTNFDQMWGLLGDMGRAASKFGSDLRPLVARVQELAGVYAVAAGRTDGVEGLLRLPQPADQQAIAADASSKEQKGLTNRKG
jgi:hypothetical protein